MTLSELILDGKEKLRAAGLQCADPLLHMKQIVELALGLSTSQLYLRWDDPLSGEELARVLAFLQRRLRGEPFQYICGEEWFWDSRFQVGPGVLIPRRETECLVEQMLACEKADRVRVGELGAGSGNIGLTLLRERPRWEWHAFERNPDSLPYLRANREALLPPEARYCIHEGDFFEKAARLAPYDWIVANPPYVASGALAELAREVRHEPELALVGGSTGTECLERLAEAASWWLSPGGGILCEIGSDQRERVTEIFSRKDFGPPEILLDYAGLPRMVLARKRS